MPTIRIYDINNDEMREHQIDDDAYARLLRARVVSVSHPEGMPREWHLSPEDRAWLEAYDRRLQEGL